MKKELLILLAVLFTPFALAVSENASEVGQANANSNANLNIEANQIAIANAMEALAVKAKNNGASGAGLTLFKTFLVKFVGDKNVMLEGVNTREHLCLFEGTSFHDEANAPREKGARVSRGNNQKQDLEHWYVDIVDEEYGRIEDNVVYIDCYLTGSEIFDPQAGLVVREVAGDRD